MVGFMFFPGGAPFCVMGYGTLAVVHVKGNSLQRELDTFSAELDRVKAYIRQCPALCSL